MEDAGSRRAFLKLLFGSAVGGSFLMLACRDKAEEIAAEAAKYDPELECTDTEGLYDAEIEVRTKNEYTSQSPREDQYCFNCKNFVLPKVEGECGTCTTVKGAIAPLGWCSAWAER